MQLEVNKFAIILTPYFVYCVSKNKQNLIKFTFCFISFSLRTWMKTGTTEAGRMQTARGPPR